MAVGILLAQPSFAQSSNKVEKAKYFLSVEQMPDATKFLPDPPAFGSEAFKMDSIVYENGKRLRASERGALAVEDAKTSIRYILRRFSPAMEKELTPERYPVLADFVYRTYTTSRTQEASPYKRKRLTDGLLTQTPHFRAAPAFALHCAEAEGFEPPERCRSTVFKTAAIDHSATPPIFCYIQRTAKIKIKSVLPKLFLLT